MSNLVLELRSIKLKNQQTSRKCYKYIINVINVTKCACVKAYNKIRVCMYVCMYNNELVKVTKFPLIRIEIEF